MARLNLGHPSDQESEEEVHTHGVGSQENDRNNHDHGGPLEFGPRWPGAFAKFFARFLNVICQALELALAPKDNEKCPQDRDPDAEFCIFVHAISLLLAEGEGFEPPKAVTP